MPPKLDGWYRLYHNAPETIYSSDTSIQSFLDLEYTQFTAAINFLYPEALFSTEHGVKGEEYDNVVFVISKGWNQYQFETYAPMINGKTSVPIDPIFRLFLVDLVGEQNIFTYSQYLETSIN